MSLTTTVVLVAKNEKSYLIEWVAYYRALGFDEIVIYDNNSYDGSASLLKKLASEGIITYRPWPMGRNEPPQVAAFEHAVENMNTDWFMFVDADEFLVLHKHNSIKELLAEFSQAQDIGAIGLNWRIFGDSFHQKYEPLPVTQRFVHAAEDSFPANRHIKSINRRVSVNSVVNRHYCDVSGRIVYANGEPLALESYSLSPAADFSVAQVNHYYCKTFEEFRKKMARGKAWVSEANAVEKYSYDEFVFGEHNRNDVLDESALAMRDVLKIEAEFLNKLLSK